ncbi:MAG: hypothetical protein POELPBGB_02816 [Bacteroidia bacterium]|nr:hypothetical protein [Bacteroidia bacterium]
MKPHHKALALFLLLLLFTGFTTLTAQNIEVKIAGMRSTSGQIHIKIFKDDRSFKDDKEYRKLSYKKDGAVNGEMTVKFNLEPGTYGFALLDDESNNGQMDYNFIGLPDEGFGFSNFYLTGLNRPKFDLFKLTVKPDQAQNVLMKVRYL